MRERAMFRIRHASDERFTIGEPFDRADGV
jgi:hypothetical protein